MRLRDDQEDSLNDWAHRLCAARSTLYTPPKSLNLSVMLIFPVDRLIYSGQVYIARLLEPRLVLNVMQTPDIIGSGSSDNSIRAPDVTRVDQCLQRAA